LLVYFSARIGPVVAAALATACLVLERRASWSQRRNAGIFLVGLVVGYGPMTVYTARRPSTLFGRAGITLFDAKTLAHQEYTYRVASVREVVLESAKRTFLACHLYGDSHPHFRSKDPMVDAPTAALLVVAIGVSLRRARAPARAALLAWILGTGLLGG